MKDRLQILFAAPSYWPAVSFGGPIWMARELNAHAAANGHHVDVVTTSLPKISTRGAWRTQARDVDGTTVYYLATPICYRGTGITPTLRTWLGRLARPDIVHIFGYRDVVSTGTARWCRRHRIPYVFEPLGMLLPKLRKVALKRVIDPIVYGQIVNDAGAVVATSKFEIDEIMSVGVDPGRIKLRPNGFPEPRNEPQDGWLRKQLGVAPDATIVLYVGRICVGKGIEHLLASVRAIPQAHLVLVGPDNADGIMDLVKAAQADDATRGRVHVIGPTKDARPFALYSSADVFVLASEGESFGMVAAEAAACGTPTIVTDRCGVADFFANGGALIVPYEERAVCDGIARVIGDPALRRELSEGGRAVAAENSWARMAEIQEGIYRQVIEESAAAGAA